MKPYAVNQSYRFTLFMATLLHIFLFSVLFLTLRHSKPLFLTAAAPMAIIHATAISSRQLPVLGEKEKVALPPTAQTALIKPALIEKSPAILAMKEQKPTILNTVPMLIRTTPVAAPLRVKNAVTKKSPADKLVQDKPLRLSKIKKTNRPLSPQSLKIAQNDIKQRLQQEVNTLVQKQQMAAQNTAITEKYRQLILQSIAQHWIIPPTLNKQLETRLVVQLAPGGMVLAVIVVKSSGNAVLDRSAQTAVYKASPLPVPRNVAVFNLFREINLTVRPEGVMTQ